MTMKASMSTKLPEIANRSARRKSVAEIAQESEDVFAARSYRRTAEEQHQSHHQNQNNEGGNRKILVRLPKVGLQLFSAN